MEKNHYDKSLEALLTGVVPLPDRFQKVEYRGWGKFIEPSIPKSKEQIAGNDKLRLVLFISYAWGRELLREVLKFVELGTVEVAGIVTDDVIDPKAKISKKRGHGGISLQSNNAISC